MNSVSRDQDEPLAVHSVDEFVFSVPDLAEARRFYLSFGLDVRQENNFLALYTFGSNHRYARIFQGPTKRILWISLGIYESAVQDFARHLAGKGIKAVSAPEGAADGGMWIQGPDGLLVQLRAAEKSSPSQAAPRHFPPENGNFGRSPARSKAGHVRPLYLSHILLFTADVDSARQFYEGVLGLRLSDRSGSLIAFMHSPHGSDHHLIALAKGSGLGLHHSSWAVPSIDAVGQGAQQMVEAGYLEGWGIGRHVLGSNYFRYVRDPWGSYAEYSYDIDFVRAGDTWPAGDHPPEDSLYVWGPALPADFIVNHEVQ